MWLPNHFVPLLGNDQILSGSKTSSPISIDSPSPHFITSPIKLLLTNNEENENITLTAQKTTVNEDMLITDNTMSPLTIAPPAKVSSSENADGLSNPESDEPGTNSVKDHQFDCLGDENVKPNDSSKKNQLSRRFLNVEELFEVLQSSPASSWSIPQGVKENTYFLVENCKNIEKTGEEKQLRR